MELISWNVNGIRATHKKGELGPVFKRNPDALLLQETKAEPDQLPEELADPEGYNAYFNYSRARKGYSGVATYTKETPTTANYSLYKEAFDVEGRLIELHFDDFVLFNVYFPNGSTGNKRVPFKLDFYDSFLEHIENLRKNGHAIVIGGDVNTAHEEIDLARPKENEDNTGFLPEERAWLDELFRLGYVDTFRHFYPNKEGAYTYWDQKTAARERNVGWRLDYFIVSPDLVPRLKKAEILRDVYGSDHCPILLELTE